MFYNNNDFIEFDEFEDEYDFSAKSDVFSEAVIWGTDWTTETIALQLEKKNIDLNPSFQRRDAWTDQEKSKLIESLMLGIPVPPIILAENKDKKNSYIVIDGKQRLLTIMKFFAGKNMQTEYGDKSYLTLRGLDILSEINSLNYSLVASRFEEYITNLENQTIRTIVIKNWPNEQFLYTVFLRLNTGSKKLSSQELRQALKPGPFLDYLDTATAESQWFWKALNNSGPDARMRDVELALRCFAYKLNAEKYQGNLKLFLDNTCESLNSKWNKDEFIIKNLFADIETAIAFSYELMKDDKPFSRKSDEVVLNRFNRCIFELFIYFFSDEKIRELVSNNREEFISSFIDMNNNEDFIAAIRDTTKEVKRVATRFKLFGELLINLDNTTAGPISIDVFDEIDGRIRITKKHI